MEEKVTVELTLEDDGVQARVGVAGLPPGLLKTKPDPGRAPKRRAKKRVTDLYPVPLRMGYVQVILVGRGMDEVDFDLFVVPKVLADPMGLSVGWMGRPLEGALDLLPSIPVDDYFRPFKGAVVSARDAPVGLPKPPWQKRSEFLERTRREELEAEKKARQELARNAVPFGEWRARRAQERRDNAKVSQQEEGQAHGKGPQSYGGGNWGQPHSRAFSAQGSFPHQSPQSSQHRYRHQQHRPAPYQSTTRELYYGQDRRSTQVVSPPDLHRTEMSSDSLKFPPSWAVSGQDSNVASSSKSPWTPHQPWIGNDTEVGADMLDSTWEDIQNGPMETAGWGFGGVGDSGDGYLAWEQNQGPYHDSEKVDDSGWGQPVRKGRASSVCGQMPEDFPVGRSTADGLDQNSQWLEPGIGRRHMDGPSQSRRNSSGWDEHRVNRAMGGRIMEEPHGNSRWLNDAGLGKGYLDALSERSMGSRSTGSRSGHSQHVRSGSYMSGGSHNGKMNVEVVESFERWSGDSSRDGGRDDLQVPSIYKGGPGKVVTKGISKSSYSTTWETTSSAEAQAVGAREHWFHGNDVTSPSKIMRGMDTSQYPFKRSIVKSSFAPKKMGPDKKGKVVARPSETSPYLTSWEDAQPGPQNGVDRMGPNRAQAYSSRDLMESGPSLKGARVGKKEQVVARPVEGSPYLTTWDTPSGSGSACEIDSGAWEGPSDIVERGGSALDRPIQNETHAVKMQSSHSSIGRPGESRKHMQSDGFMSVDGGRRGGNHRNMSHPRNYGRGKGGQGRAYSNRLNRDFNREDARNHDPQWNHHGGSGMRGKYPQGSRLRKGPGDRRPSQWTDEDPYKRPASKRGNAPHAHLEHGSGTDRPTRLGPGSHEFNQRNLGARSDILHHTSEARPSSSSRHQGFESGTDETRVQYSRLSEKPDPASEGGSQYKVCGMIRSDSDSRERGGPATLFKRVLAGALKDCIQAKEAKLSAPIHGEGSVQLERRIPGPREPLSENPQPQRTRGIRPRCLSDVNAIPVPSRRGGPERQHSLQ